MDILQYPDVVCGVTICNHLSANHTICGMYARVTTMASVHLRPSTVPVGQSGTRCLQGWKEAVMLCSSERKGTGSDPENAPLARSCPPGVCSAGAV